MISIEGSGEYYFSPAAFMQLDNDNDNQCSSDEEDDDGAHTVCKVMTSRTDSNTNRRELAEREYKDIEYIRRVREVSKECPMIVSWINKFNA